MMQFRTILLLAAAALATLSGCSERLVRDEAKATLKHIAAGYEKRDPDEALSVYVKDFVGRDSQARMIAGEHDERGVKEWTAPGVLDRAAWRAAFARDIAMLERVERAKFVMESFEEERGGYAVEASFNLWATDKTGALCHESSRHRFFLVDDEDADEKHPRLLVQEHDVTDRRAEKSSVRYFADRTADAGLDIDHADYVKIPAGPEGNPVVPNHFLGSGVSSGDVDGDGWLDLLVGDGYQSRIMRNLGNGKYENMTKAAGLGTVGKVRGAYLVDLDNDGRLDAFLARVKQTPAVFLNRGGWRFEDISARAFEGVGAGEGTSAAFGDLDGDGDLDCYLANYGDYDRSGWAWPIWDAVNGEPATVLRNRGDATFEQVIDPVLTPKGWGLAVGMADYDDDGDQDIYVANDYGVNHLYRNDGKWKFTDVSVEAGAVDQGYGMGVAWGDYDGDGDLDLYVTNMFSSSRWVFGDPNFPLPLIAQLLFRGWVEDQMMQVTHGNTLLRNDGGGKFTQVERELGVDRADWAWGGDFVDFDNDGDLDIYSPNGFISGPDEADQ